MNDEIHPTVAWLNGVMAEMSKQRQAAARNMKLGQLIDALSKMPAGKPIATSTGQSPGRFMSYRGYYEDLAFDVGEACTVGEFLARAREARGKVFTGYKGGDFPMHDHSLLWFSEYGSASGDAPVEVREFDEGAVLVIERCEADW